MKRNLLKNDGVQSLLASLVCVVLGLFLGYVVLLAINPAGAGEAILTVIKNFLTYNRPSSQLKYLGNTLVKTAPLLMCALSILFAYKVGLFNIGAAGQYCMGAALSLYAALGLGWGWLPCLIAAMLGGAVLGAISGLLKSYCNVNEVISGIMLNWITLYLTNMLLTTVKEDTAPIRWCCPPPIPPRCCPLLALGRCLTTISMWALPFLYHWSWRFLYGWCWAGRSSAMSSRPPALIKTPLNTAAWRKSGM